MNKKYFNASSWLQMDSISKTGPSNLNDRMDSSVTSEKSFHNDLYFSFNQKLKKKDFDPTLFFTPGFEEGLLSKDGLIVKKNIQLLQKDVVGQFHTFPNFNKSLKVAIYNEFLCYADSKALHCHDLDDHISFWKYLQLKNSKYKDVLNDFIENYSFRVALFYFFKIRFMVIFSQEAMIPLSDKDFLNPSSFFSQAFKKGSSSELRSEVLQSNHYTWFRPSPAYISLLSKIITHLKKISLTECLSLITPPQVNSTSPSNTFPERPEFSHAISHKNFGSYLRLLMVDFPEWITEPSEKRPFQHYFHSSHQQQMPFEILTCKITGDHIESLALSHWLSQDSGSLTNGPILCPTFIGDNPHPDHFLKLCYEWQFLTSLLYTSKLKGLSPVSFICTLTKLRHENQTIFEDEQFNLFQDYLTHSQARYDRVILNLTKFPKNNPHFYLINQIQSQLNGLKKDGHIIILTNKKLFVPSQSDKVEHLLKEVKLEGMLSLDAVKGKGEIPSFIYIFSKKTAMNSFPSDFSSNHGPIFNRQSAQDDGMDLLHPKDSCLNFRFSGELSSFNKFSIIVDGLKKFFRHRKIENTPLFQSEWEDNVAFEFYQDAIVDGRLIHSTSQDSSKITHPIFFKNLMKSCLPLSHFFHIENVQPELDESKYNHSEDLYSGFLGVNFEKQQKFSNILIVDFRNNHRPQLELTTVEAYKGKVQEYGLALCQYFGIIPKIPHTNINLFREFFSTAIGLQLIQLSLTGGASKLKAKLNSILVPKFFADPSCLPEHFEKSLEILTVNGKELLTKDPKNIESLYNSLVPILLSLGKKYPWAIMSLLSYFQATLAKCISQFETSGKSGPINFSHPIIIDGLIQTKSFPLHPNNPEIYFEFKIQHPQEIKSSLTHMSLIGSPDKDQEDCCLELHSGKRHILSIYSHLEILLFLKYLFQVGINVPILQIVQGTKIPSFQDLKKIIGRYQDLKTAFEHMHEQNSSLIDQVLKEQISIQ